MKNVLERTISCTKVFTFVSGWSCLIPTASYALKLHCPFLSWAAVHVIPAVDGAIRFAEKMNITYIHFFSTKIKRFLYIQFLLLSIFQNHIL
jgi:hypothetical protein